MAKLPDPHDGLELWLRERVPVAEPFRSMFRLVEAERVVLLAKLAKALDLPPRNFEWPTENFIERIYTGVSDAWVNGPDPQRIVTGALWHLNDEALADLADDFGWAGNLVLERVTPATYETQLRQAVVDRMTRRVETLLKRLRRASRAVA